MKDESRFEVRDFVDADEPALVALHRAGFPGHPLRTAEQWRWKYRSNPLRRAELVVVDERGAGAAAIFGGVPHRIVLEGRECFAVVHTDVTVAPRFVGTATAARLIAAAGERFFERWGGDPNLLTWGFPEPALRKLGVRFFRFEVLRDVAFLVREAESGAASRAGVVVERVPRFAAVADTLWSRCAGELQTALVRDARYLDWRYAEQPGIEHVLLVAREHGHGAARGLAVVRPGGWSDEIASLVEWLVPRGDRDAESALVAAALAEAVRLGRRWLACWFVGAGPELHRFQRDHGFFIQPTPYQECFRSWTRRASRRFLAENWYQTMGDIDFF